MSKNTLVTSNQTDAVRNMANAKGVTRAQFQAAQDDGRIARFLDTLKVDPTALTPPPGACLHTVHIRFKPDREWQESINAAGPNTPNDYNVRKVGDQYPPTGTEEIEEDLILLNFENGDGFDAALAWAKSKQLENTVPREVFAIGEQHPKLHEELGQNPMYVAATKECTFVGYCNTCYVWWRGSKRKVGLFWVENFDNSHIWFAFRKSALKTQDLYSLKCQNKL
jgi:hypothetical protein